jgi:hypothetical protein
MVKELQISPMIIRPPGGWWWPREQEDKQPEMFFPIPLDGFIEIPINIPPEVTRVDIAVSYIVQNIIF